MNLLQDLNECQRSAVTASEGPLLIVAGPGTGKTLTIVYRIAHLVHKGVKPENILAVTFTNRAAREMRERADALLGARASGIFIGTFHLFGLRILQETGSHEFEVYDRDEQIALLKELFKVTVKKADHIAETISSIKSFLVLPDDDMKTICDQYETALVKNAAFDFDDLIAKPVRMFEERSILEKYRNTFRYIIVDEYQDINPAQYKLIKLLAGDKGNLCAVGDPDQSIYAFRGADSDHFLNFGKDFKGTQTIILSENYRSMTTIIEASDRMIKNNMKRIVKELKPRRARGKPISAISVPDERAESEIIVREIEERIGGTSHSQLMNRRVSRDFGECSFSFSDFAVIFRTNAQAKTLGEAFNTRGIPYQIIGKKSSLQQKRVEDTVSYVKGIIHPPEQDPTHENSSMEEKLLTPADYFDPRADAVTLMTLHMAKGLEFKIVFIAGIEDGLIPYSMRRDDVDVEEERRLFYVGMTRAMDELFLLYSRGRFLYGKMLSQSPSPFLNEIPAELLQTRFIPDRIKKDKKEKQMGLF